MILEILYLNDVKFIIENENIIISYSCDVLEELFSKYVIDWSKNNRY